MCMYIHGKHPPSPVSSSLSPPHCPVMELSIRPSYAEHQPMTLHMEDGANNHLLLTHLSRQ